jgi:hypothetical protein
MIKTLYEICPIRFGPDGIHPFGCSHCNGTGFVPAAQILPCEDHPVLDVIARAITPEFDLGRPDDPGPAECVTRESECVEFRDTTNGRRFEVIVRPIPDEEDRP